MEKKEVVEKIHKLLAIANGNANENECQSAMLMVQKLMAKHKLSMDSVQLKEEEKGENVLHVKISDFGESSWWQCHLSSIIAPNFRCIEYLQKHIDGNYLVFIGTTEDVSIAKDVFSFANKNITYCANQYMKENKCKDSAIRNTYIEGYLIGLTEKFKEQVAKEQLALVVVAPDAVKESFKKLNTKDTKPSKHMSTNSQHAFSEGYYEGKSFDHTRKRLEFNVKWYK